MTAFQGPLPSPDAIEHYDRILPGAADRIVAQWEQQSGHRQALERHTITSNLTAQTRGQYFALFICLAILGVAVWLFSRGADGWAFATIVGELAAVLLAFIYGRSRQDRERRDKDSNN